MEEGITEGYAEGALQKLEGALQRNTAAFSGQPQPAHEEEELLEGEAAAPTGLTQTTATGEDPTSVTPVSHEEVVFRLPSSAPSSSRSASTLSAIEHQETRSTPRRLIQQIQYTNNPTTEAVEVVDNLLEGHGEDLRTRERLQNVVIEMTRAIRKHYTANAEAEGCPAVLPDLERKEGEDEDTI
jgi:hypothetical protein